MKKSVLLNVIFCLTALTGFTQQPDKTGQEQTEEKKEVQDQKFGIQFHGFVKNDFILDSRQVVSARDGHFLLYPASEILDPDGEDINSRGTFNYLAIQSRLTGKITGPDVFGAKLTGIMEGAFFGNIESNLNSFRLRHAYIKLNWTNTEILLGQYWHIMFVTGCFPGTVSFNTGAPFQFFSRNPQIRLSQKLGYITLTGTVSTQLDFSSPGGPDVLRNALLPDLGGRLSFSNDMVYTGIAVGYKQLMPRLQTDSAYQATALVRGFTGEAFLKITTKPLTYKLQAIYAQNGFDGLFTGGYAVSSITDPVRDYREYTTLDVTTVWAEIHTNEKKFQGGLFLGYSRNMGSMVEIEELDMIRTYARGADIRYIYRIAPRFIMNLGKFRFAAEYEHTGTGYGDSFDSKGIPQNVKRVANNRILVATYLFF